MHFGAIKFLKKSSFLIVIYYFLSIFSFVYSFIAM